MLFLRHTKDGKQILAGIAKKHGKGKALSILAHRIWRAVFYMTVGSGRALSGARVVTIVTGAMENRAKVMRDSINYFPPGATQGCRIGYFAELQSRAMAYDQVELSWQRACLGCLYFNVPGGIKYGQHWLNVKFQGSLVRVPFRIFTAEEKKTLSKNYRDIRTQVQEAFAPPKKK